MSIFARFKKLFLILAFLAIVFLFGYLLYKFFFAGDAFVPGETIVGPSTPGSLPSSGVGSQTGEEFTDPGKLPSFGTDGAPINTPVGRPDPQASAPSIVADGGLTQVSLLNPNPVLNPTLTTGGHVQYYDRSDGRFYRTDENGNAVRLSDRVFHRVSQVTWAPNNTRAIIEYPDSSKIMYDFNTQKQVTLPSHWKDFSFASNSEQIIAKSIGLDPDNRWLVVAGSDGSKATAIEPIGTKDATIFPSWSPNNQIVAMYTEGIDFDRNEIFFLGLNNENFKSTIVEGRGLQAQWSKTGENLLYSAYHSRDNYIPRLWLVGASGDNIGSNRRNLDLMTWADKCTFASNTEVYCAVPEYLEEGAGIFPELANRSKDNLYKIDLNTGAKTLIAIPEGAYNVSQIMVPENQNRLYFTDKITDMMYQVQLR